MTLREYLMNRLRGHGLSDVHMLEIMGAFMTSLTGMSLADLMPHLVQDHDKVTLRVLWIAFKIEALKWLEEHDPDHPAYTALQEITKN